MGTDRPFKNADEVFRYLDSFHNMERGLPARSFRLDRVEKLAALAGDPQHACPAIHIAGSKGKGSTSTMLASILAAAGIRTGLYLSPHVVDYRERISLAGAFLSEDSYAAAGDELRAAVGRIGPRGLPGGEEATFFELFTILAFIAFRREACRAVVIETGLGGRLDATNILDPRATVLTAIELEHTEYLGATIPLIAGEKAGIIKTGRSAFVAEQNQEAIEVFRRVALEKSAPLSYLPDELEALEARVEKNGTDIRVAFRDRAAFPRPLMTKLSLVGAVQAANAALAALCIRRTFPEVDDASIESGLAGARIPARFERILDDPVTVVDGAHTERSVGLAAATFSEIYGRGGILLFGCAAGKDAGAMARALVPHFSVVYLTRPGTFRKSDPETAFRAFSACDPNARRMDDTKEALLAAVQTARERGLPLLVTGSFYLAGEAKRILAG